MKTTKTTTKKNTIEAYGNKGMKRTPWRKEFKDADAMLKWAEEHDAEIESTRDLEQDADTK